MRHEDMLMTSKSSLPEHTTALRAMPEQTLGERVQMRLTKLGKKQSWLASELGWKSSSQISRWVTDGVIPRGDVLVRLPALLECDANWLLNGGEEAVGAEPRLDYVARRLTELLQELDRGVGLLSSLQSKAHEFSISPENLKHSFLAAIQRYNDLTVERYCGLNHETVRQYRKVWPQRGPTRATTKKMIAMIEIHEEILEEESIVTGKTLPPRAAGLIAVAEEQQADPAFVKKYPKLGWISVADGVAKAWRNLDLMTIHDEFAWLGYKRAHHFDPEEASQVTPEDVGLDMTHVLPGAAEHAGSND